jgi:O-antigen/teichoic acid export membrane protein
MGRVTRVASALRFAVALDLVGGIVILSGTLGVVTLGSLHLGHETRGVTAVAAVMSFVGVTDGSFAAVLYAHQAFGWLSAYQIVANGSRCIALLALPIGSAIDAAWATAMAQAVTTAFVIIVVVWRFLPRNVQSESLPAADRRWLVGFSIHIALASAVATVRATAIPLVLGAIGTKRQVAGARVAESPTRLLGTVVAPLRTILFPRLSAAWARRDRAEARRLIGHYLATTMLLAGALGAAMAVAINFVLTKIYGPAYGGLERVGQFFVLAALLDALAGWQKVAPAALDRPWLRTFILIGESIILLAGLAILVPPYGPLGAAISSSVAAAASLAIGAYWLRPAFAEQSWGELPLEGPRHKAYVARHPR